MTAAEREVREQVRLVAAERFAAGNGTGTGNEDVARELRVSVRSVERWRAAWRRGGPEALVS